MTLAATPHKITDAFGIFIRLSARGPPANSDFGIVNRPGGMLPPGGSFHGVRRSAATIMITAMTDCAPGERDGTHIARVPANSPFEFHVSPNISLGTIGTAVVLSAAAIPTTALVAICTAHGHWPIAFFGILTFAGLLFGFLGGRRSLSYRSASSSMRGRSSSKG